MTAEVISIQNFVNATIRQTPSVLGEINPNNMLLITTEIPSNIDEYRTYLNARQVGLDYGTNSETYALANAIFSQSPNILTGNGKLIVAPFVSSPAAVSATRGRFVSADLDANLNALKAVDDGDLKVTINGGTPINLTLIDFTACSTIADVAVILQRRLPDLTITEASGVITFTSKKVGSTSTVALAAVSGGAGTDLTASGLLNVSGGSATGGANSSGETVVAAYTRLSAIVQFTPFITNKLIEDSVAVTTATSVEASDKIWFNVWSDSNDIDGTISTIKASNQRTIALFYSDVSNAQKFMAADPATLCSVNFSGNNTFLNANTQLRTLNGIPADSGMTQALFDKAASKGANIYANVGGLNCIVNNRYGDSGQYQDQVYGRQALVYSITTGEFNALRSGAIQQTPQGLDKLISATNAVFARFVRAGYIGTGLNWNSPITFGNEQDFRDSVFSVGYYIYANSIANQLQSERENRDAPLQQVAYKEAGFIYRASVDVLVEA
jgi:hypothetical protein